MKETSTQLTAKNGGRNLLDITIKVASIPKIVINTFQLRLVGDSPLLMHKWSEKALKEMEDKQAKKPRQAKEAKDPHQCYLDSIYRDAQGNAAFPAVAFKNAAVDACSHCEGITKVEARGAFHVVGNLVRIIGDHVMQRDTVRLAMGVADLRYRAAFPDWSCVLDIRHNPNVLTMDQIINLFSLGGFAIGIGEWRPQKDGSYGMFHVA